MPARLASCATASRRRARGAWLSNPKAVIYGLAGHRLTDDERSFFSATDPLGFILFARNIAEPAQVSDLVASLRALIGRPDAPVLIDQEGGRVQRLKPPH